MAGNSRPFMDFLREQRNGLLHDELSDKLQELVAAVVEAKKAGKITITIALKPEGDVIVSADEVKVALPKVPNSPSIFFPTVENNLQRQDPRQAAMELRPIGTSSERPGALPPREAARTL